MWSGIVPVGERGAGPDVARACDQQSGSAQSWSSLTYRVTTAVATSTSIPDDYLALLHEMAQGSCWRTELGGPHGWQEMALDAMINGCYTYTDNLADVSSFMSILGVRLNKSSLEYVQGGPCQSINRLRGAQ